MVVVSSRREEIPDRNGSFSLPGNEDMRVMSRVGLLQGKTYCIVRTLGLRTVVSIATVAGEASLTS